MFRSTRSIHPSHDLSKRRLGHVNVFIVLDCLARRLLVLCLLVVDLFEECFFATAALRVGGLELGLGLALLGLFGFLLLVLWN